MKIQRSRPNWLNELKGDVKRAVEDEVAIHTNKIADSARRDVVIDDGFLKNSIQSDVKGLGGEVEATANYAPYVEFGTGGLVDVPKGMEDYAIQFKGKNIKKINLQPRPFLMPNFMREGENFKKKLKNIADGDF